MDISRLNLDALMTEASEKDLDVYQLIAARALGKDMDEVSDEDRQDTKTAVFRWMYTPKGKVVWSCFHCERTYFLTPSYVASDGSKWCSPPPGWLLTVDGDEITVVCSRACLDGIYEEKEPEAG